eukprot:TRINITY_DN51398_c0_g1_i1.p1 TRINITY_DN51398_c0_g1~~TRINITY_DN51398_c0_g1_i1.p1  ORF type:complete len:138 (-),score=32.93 TRINITY_DN51398_c0_g1_i1:32-445(-)
MSHQSANNKMSHQSANNKMSHQSANNKMSHQSANRMLSSGSGQSAMQDTARRAVTAVLHEAGQDGLTRAEIYDRLLAEDAAFRFRSKRHVVQTLQALAREKRVVTRRVWEEGAAKNTKGRGAVTKESDKPYVYVLKA